jgi:hypothetical protein
MKRSEVVRLAYEAGCKSIIVPEEWFRFAKLVAAAEREACADIAENWKCNGMPRTVLADQIRERGAP